MTNREKYKEELVRITSWYGDIVAATNGKIKPCIHTQCSKCDFNDRYEDCQDLFKKWADSKYLGLIN